MSSIRKVLLLTLLPAVLGLMAVSVLAVLHEVRDEIDELFDAQLIQAAYAVPATASAQESRAESDADDPTKDLVIAAWDAPSSAPRFYSRTRVALDAAAPMGFSTSTLSNESWRVYARAANSGKIVVAQPLRIRNEASAEIAARIALPMLLLVPVVVVTVLLLLKRGLRPLTHFAEELDSRSPSALESIPIRGLPAELSPMATAMNQLLARLQGALSAQEVFVADAAHEMLTPLTALQVQIQMLERARSDERRTQVTEDVRRSLERCINLAQQLLALARHSREHPAEPPELLVLGDAVRAAVSNVLPRAHERAIDLGIASELPCRILGDDKAIQTLLINVLDNAIKYAPAGGRVDVTIGSSGARTVIAVSDTGPGIPQAEHTRVFDRFYRGNGVDAEGSGLGLAIAREIAERHAATISLNSPGRLGGLDVEVSFPNLEG